MSELKIQFDQARTRWVPGQKLSGVAEWCLDQPATSVDLRLFWYTEGKGTQDVSIIWTTTLDHPPPHQSHPFHFDLPSSPYSFSGKLISLIWAVEMIVRPSAESTRATFTLSPIGEEIELHTASDK